MAARLEEMGKSMDKERQSSSSTKMDMAITHQRVQESLADEIVRLSQAIRDLQDEAAEKDVQFDVIRAQHELAISKKDNEVLNIKRQMDDMAQEFNGMLSATLDRMSQRLEFVSTGPTLPARLNLDSQYAFKWSSMNTT